MNWFFAITRIAGASFPGASSLVQLQAELGAEALSKRVQCLEDPISTLHEDVPELSKKFYEVLTETDYNKAQFDDDVYSKFSRAIAVLDKKGVIECQHALGTHNPVWIYINDPSYIMYLCERFGDSKSMEALVQRLESCKRGEWLDGKIIAKELKLPRPVVAACFDIYEAKGFGERSARVGSTQYCGRA